MKNLFNKNFRLLNLEKFIVRTILLITCLSFSSIVMAQNKTVTGKVTDKNDEAIIGASVFVENSTNGTVTDIDGNFTLKNVPSNGTLKVSYIGYKVQFISVKGHTNFAVKLLENSEMLDEIVVIGYGTTTKKNVIGAVDQVSAKAFADRPSSNIAQALQGASANLVIQQKSFNPLNDNTSINIRGVSTMGANTPLIVIDGLISDVGAMNSLNPNDISSVSVLKDAGSAAIYGSRSANGVILISTKSGNKNQTPTVKFNAMLGVQDPHVLFSAVHGWQNAILRNEALVNGGSSPIYTTDNIKAMYDNGDCKPFIDQILQSAVQQNYSASVEGGSNNTTYLMSANYFGQPSNYVGPNYGVSRYNFRMNLTTEVGRLKLSSNMMYTRSNIKTHTGDDGFLMVDCTRVPLYYNYRMKSDDGSLYYTNDVLSESNPLGTLEKGGYKKSDNDRFNGSYTAELKLFDGLKLKGVFGAQILSEHRWVQQNAVEYATNYNATKATWTEGTYNASDWSGKTTLLNSQIMLDYNKSFGKHNVAALFGYSDESFRYQGIDVNEKYVDPYLHIPNTSTVIDSGNTHLSSQSTTERSIKSWFGRASYNYNDKYYGEFDMRIDRSSKFASLKRSGLFPSVSLGWRISEENFMNAYKSHVGDLKIRGSYGILGNQDNVSDYEYQTTYTMYQNVYAFNNSPVSGTGFTLGNINLTWEKSHTFNMGFDATFLNNSLIVNADYFYKRTKDILLRPVVAGVFGGSLPSQNRGEMSNKGWEVTLAYNLNTKNWNHRFSLNVADSKNELLKYGDPSINTNDNVTCITAEGFPLNSYYGYKVDHYFKNMEEIENSAVPTGYTVMPGDVKYVDQNGDEIIDEKDRVVLGNGFPRYTFGFTYNVEWKGFDFSVLFQGVGKRDRMVRGELIEPFHSNYSYTMYNHQLDYWTLENTDARWPRLSSPGSASNTNNYHVLGGSSDLYMLNGAYMRCKNIQLGYTLPANIAGKLGCKSVKMYVNAQNLFTICKDGFVDPESSELGSNMSFGSANSARNYPMLKYYGFGLDLTF